MPFTPFADQTQSPGSVMGFGNNQNPNTQSPGSVQGFEQAPPPPAPEGFKPYSMTNQPPVDVFNKMSDEDKYNYSMGSTAGASGVATDLVKSTFKEGTKAAIGITGGLANLALSGQEKMLEGAGALGLDTGRAQKFYKDVQGAMNNRIDETNDILDNHALFKSSTLNQVVSDFGGGIIATALSGIPGMIEEGVGALASKVAPEAIQATKVAKMLGDPKIATTAQRLTSFGTTATARAMGWGGLAAATTSGDLQARLEAAKSAAEITGALETASPIFSLLGKGFRAGWDMMTEKAFAPTTQKGAADVLNYNKLGDYMQDLRDQKVIGLGLEETAKNIDSKLTDNGNQKYKLYQQSGENGKTLDLSDMKKQFDTQALTAGLKGSKGRSIEDIRAAYNGVWKDLESRMNALKVDPSKITPVQSELLKRPLGAVYEANLTDKAPTATQEAMNWAYQHIKDAQNEALPEGATLNDESHLLMMAKQNLAKFTRKTLTNQSSDMFDNIALLYGAGSGNVPLASYEMGKKLISFPAFRFATANMFGKIGDFFGTLSKITDPEAIMAKISNYVDDNPELQKTVGTVINNANVKSPSGFQAEIMKYVKNLQDEKYVPKPLEKGKGTTSMGPINTPNPPPEVPVKPSTAMGSLSPEDTQAQQEAFDHLSKNKDQMVKDYIQKNDTGPFKQAETPQTTLKRLAEGNVVSEETDSAKISSLSTPLLNNGRDTPVLLNKKNYDIIKIKHPNFNHDDLIETGKNPTDRFLFKQDGEPFKINIVKQNPDKSIFVIGANRFNGYGIITFFDQIDAKKAAGYLKSLKRRGIEF